MKVQVFAIMACVGAVIGLATSAVTLLAMPEDAPEAVSVTLPVVVAVIVFAGLEFSPRVMAYVPPLPLSRAFGIAVRWFRARAVQTVLSILVIAVGIWLLDAFLSTPLPTPKPGWVETGRVFAILALLLALLWAVRARRRMVVEEFADYTGDDAMRTRGLAQLLVHEMAHLSELHRAADEGRAIETAVGKAGALNPSMSTGGDAEFLRKDFSAEGQVRLGPLAVPVRTVGAMLGRLARGARLGGGLHLHGEQLLLVAHTAGVRPAYGWKVERTVPPQGEIGGLINDMASELACRMFTDLALGRSVRWTATRCFARGLEAYRDSLKTARGRLEKHEDAERRFIEAASEDNDFDLAYTNLGVAYLETDRVAAAEQAFRAALDVNASRLEAHYALALIDLQREDHEAALWRCDRLLRHGDRAHAAEAAALVVVIHLEQGQAKQALKLSRRALRRARRLLRRRYLTMWSGTDRRPVRREEQKLAVVLFNQAFAHVELLPEEINWRTWWHLRRAQALLRNSIRLDAKRAGTHRMLGQVLGATDNEGLRGLVTSAQLDPRDALNWALLAGALAARGEADKSRAACRQALADPHWFAAVRPDPGVFATIARAYADLGDDELANRVAAMPAFVEDLPADDDGDGAERAGFRLENEDWTDRAWERAQLLLWLLDHLPLEVEDQGQALMDEAIDLLKHDQANDEVRRRGLYGRRAALLQRSDRTAALGAARQAIEVDPINPFERSVIGNVYADLSELQAARQSFEDGLLRRPDDPVLRLELAQVLLSAAAGCGDSAKRQGLLGDAQRHAERAIAVPGSDDVQPRVFLALISYWRGHYDAAHGHAAVAHSLAPDRAALALLRGLVARRQRDFVEAEQWYSTAIETARRAPVLEGADDAVPEAEQVIDLFPGLMLSRGDAMAEAYLALAQLRLDRCVDPPGARGLARRARRELSRSRVAGTRRAGIEAQCLCAIGWSRVIEGDVEAGLQGLRRAAERHPEPECYVRWAQGLELHARQSQTDASGGHPDPREIALLARRLDTGGEFKRELDELFARLDEPTPAWPWTVVGPPGTNGRAATVLTPTAM